MVYADKITTVSDTYAREITTPYFGEGLDSLLRARLGDLLGIVNGISYEDWNPQKDEFIVKKYTPRTVKAGKAENKAALQRELGLPEEPNKMLVGIVSRLTDQKGFDLIAYKLEELCQNGGCQLVILGTGEEKYENLFRHYAWKYPNVLAAQITYSNEMSHKIYAACDAFLMPSAFEPCGLSQIISMKYGTLPIVRETGGLKDTVKPYNKFTGEGYGFSFANYNADEMLGCIFRAMDVYYNDKPAWQKLQKQAMAADYSWDVSAEKYIDMYSNITGIPRPKKEVKAPVVPKKSNFEKQLREDFEVSDKAVAQKAQPATVVEVENPFKEPVNKKTTPKKKTAKKKK